MYPWWIFNRTPSYRCHIALIKEDDGGYSAIVLNLPGVGSYGETEEEAMCNVKEAIHGALESYLVNDQEIPWIVDQSKYDIPHNASKRWIVVSLDKSDI